MTGMVEKPAKGTEPSNLFISGRYILQPEIFEVLATESLAEMTIRVLEDAELCRRLTADAFQHLRRFDWADVAERTAEVYDELAGMRSTSASGH